MALAVARRLLFAGGAITASLLGIAAFGAGAVGYMAAMPGTSFRGPLPELSAEEEALAARLRGHVAAISGAPRNVSRYAELEEAARYIEQALSAHGVTVERQAFASPAGPVRNLEVSIPAKPAGRGRPRIIVIGAHYDSAPGTPGANDNASGTAAVIELAGMLKDAPVADGHQLKLVLFVNEEEPWFKTDHMGSLVHARGLHARGEQVVAMLSLETIGYYSDARRSQHYPPLLRLLYPEAGNFIGFVGDLGSRALVRRAIASFRAHAAFPSEGIAAPVSIPGIDWSDHWAYRQFGYPAIMVTDTAPYRYPWYHAPDDTVDKIDFERMARVVKGLANVVADLANPP